MAFGNFCFAGKMIAVLKNKLQHLRNFLFRINKSKDCSALKTCVPVYNQFLYPQCKFPSIKVSNLKKTYYF